MCHLSVKKESVSRQMQTLLSTVLPATCSLRGQDCSQSAHCFHPTHRKQHTLPCNLHAELMACGTHAQKNITNQAFCNKLEAAMRFTVASSTLEGSKLALPGHSSISSLFFVDFHTAEFTDMNAINRF